MGAFQYLPLDVQKQEIRLIKIAPLEKYDDLVHLEIVHASLLDGPAFRAVSYTWGASLEGLESGWDDPTATKPILVNGHEFPVRWNLRELLWNLGMISDKKNRPFWIDAICINQKDLVERSQQVRIMDKIYKASSITLIWLGLESGDSRLALDTLVNLAKSWESRSKPLRKGNYVDSSLKEEYNALLERELKSSTSNEQLFALARLFLRPWWKRAWIVQEFVLGYTNLFICEGAPLADWDDLDFAWRVVCQHFQNFALYLEKDRRQLFNVLEFVVRAALHSRPLIELRWRFTDKGRLQSLRLPEAFQYLSRSRATDQRDKVYAALGLSADADVIDVNYTWTVGKVYTQATKACIEHYKSLYVMSFHSVPESRNVDGLPSWVIDWSDRKYGSRLPISARSYDSEVLETGEAEPLFHAGGSGELRYAFEDDDKTLVLHGFRIGQVGYTSKAKEAELIIESEIKGTVDEARLKDLLEEIQNFARIESASVKSQIENHEWLQDWLGHLTITSSLENSDTLTYEYSSGVTKEPDMTSIRYLPTKQPLAAAFTASLMCDTWIDGLYQRRRLVALNRPADKSLIRLAVDRLGFGRKFIASESHLIGLGPAETEPGDVICVTLGHPTPILLRPTSAGTHVFVGECYIHGVMDGEFVDRNENKSEDVRQPLQEFRII